MTAAEHNFRFEWQLPEQFSTELCWRSGLPNNKCPCRTHIYDTIVAQLSCKDAWAKRPVSANIDAPEENDESHTGIIEKRGGRFAIQSRNSRFGGILVRNARGRELDYFAHTRTTANPAASVSGW